MKRFVWLTSILLILTLTGIGFAQGAEVSAPTPAFIMSAGQSMDAEMIYVSANRAQISTIYDPMPKFDTIREAGAKTLIVGFGDSGKGLGAAGVSEKEEYDRIHDILTKAQEQGIFIIGAHVGGSVRRGEITHRVMDPFLEFCDAFICLEDSDFDGFFTEMSKKHGWTLLEVPMILDVGELLKEILVF